MLRLVAFVLVVSAFAFVPSVPVVAAEGRIHDCASFHAWFDRQPGAGLVLGRRDEDRHAPAPRGGSDLLPFSRETMTYYRGHVGGGGCLGAIYDPTRKTAEVLSQYDTAQDIVETTVVSPPIGVRHDVVAMPTHNGVALGMTARNVEAIEGRGSRSRSGDDVVIAYAWSVPVPEPSRPTGQPLAPTVTATMSPESFSLMFLLHDDRVVAIDYLYGF